MSKMTAQEIAEKVAAAMYEDDKASQHLGITLDAVGPGTAVMSMDVEDFMLNGHKTCHGGYIFTLADTA
ncbi:MAG: PaaI family thioesterase, partial [Sneathiella sp.]|nr:PaaI family thioesterase [Sneathiella sp.]